MLKPFIHILLTSTFIFLANSLYSQAYNTIVEAKIDMDENSEYIGISANAYNKTHTSQSIRYVLSVIKNNADDSNTSKSDQQGRFVLEAGERRSLSQTKINLEEKDRIIVLLLVYDTEEQLLGKDRIIINPTEQDKLEQEQRVQREKETTIGETYKGEDGVVLRGIVVEETKTKPGQDFFKMFYSLYTSYNVNGEGIVTIKETFAIANTTKIEIKVGNDTVLEFFIQPNNDFLKSAANEAVRIVYSYFQNLKENKNQIKQY